MTQGETLNVQLGDQYSYFYNKKGGRWDVIRCIWCFVKVFADNNLNVRQ